MRLWRTPSPGSSTKGTGLIFADAEAASSRRRTILSRVGYSLVFVSTLAIVGVGVLPSPFIVQQPGPTFDTLGSVSADGEEVPLIDIPLQETFPTTGSLTMLTVSFVGNREQPLSWFETAAAWLDPSKAVVPVDSVYPDGRTQQQSSKESRVEMEVSQQEAVAAALSELDYKFSSKLTIEGVDENGAAGDSLKQGDVVVSVNGKKFTYVSQLRAELADNGIDKEATVIVRRDGKNRTFELTPQMSSGERPAPILGVLVAAEYKFPFDVSIQLENVGGPSAGSMFALGIIDKLTEGNLNGGADVAGTGTISGEGVIGPIGGIRQKMHGAVAAGAEYFLAPERNCDEVVNNIPDGITVFAVETLDDSLAALKGIGSGKTDDLPTCS